MINRNFTIALLLLLVTCLEAQENLVGTFYGGWARSKGDYLWAKDLGIGADIVGVGDFNGDGYDDAIAASNGSCEVALSEAYTDRAGKERRHFGPKSTWISGQGGNYDNFLVGDLNGDGKSDIVTFIGSSGKWGFGVSDGSSLTMSDIVLDGFGMSSSHQFFADVNGDGKGDAVSYTAGQWDVCINNGNGFDNSVAFLSGFGTAGAQAFLADVDNDGKSDAVYYSNGAIYLAKSNGTAFVKSALAWKTGLSGFSHLMFNDVDGDKNADAILYYLSDGNGSPTKGEWKFCSSNGTNAFGAETFWTSRHGSRTDRPSKGLPACHMFITGYVQQPKTGTYGVSPIAINFEAGYWQIMPPYGMFGNSHYEPGQAPDWYNSWHTIQRGVLPLIGDEYYGFDAEEDAFAIQEIISDLAEAEIDFVLLDQTNAWAALFKSYQVFAAGIQQWNSNPENRKVRYAICGMFKSDPNQVETSARNTLMNFYNTYGKENYQILENKPLMVCYGPILNKHELWANYTGSKEMAEKFTLKWMDGDLIESNIDPNNKGDWYGWQMINGTIENDKQMVVQPGFYNGGAFISRVKNGVEGDLYRADWDKVLINKPKDVTVISLLGDPEQNDVFNMTKGEYTFGMGKTEHWSYPEMYWEMTKDYIQNFKRIKKGEIEHIAEYGTQKVTSSTMTISFSQAFENLPVLYASIQGAQTGRRLIKTRALNESTFIVEIVGARIGSDVLNWVAVKPGYWEAPNGLRLAAGSVEVSDTEKKAIELPDFFVNSPAVFSMVNTNANNDGFVSNQYEIAQNGFKISAQSSLGSFNEAEKLGWLAFESGNMEMWSGRFCNVSSPVVGQAVYEFTFPAYFYNNAVTLVKSSTGMDVSEGEPIVSATSNLGGSISYQDASTPSSDTLNILSFDGSHGSLYGTEIIDSTGGTSIKLLDKNKLKANIYPNPANDVLYLNTNGNIMHPTRAVVYDITGKILSTISIKSELEQIDISNFDAGLYYLEIALLDQKRSLKFIKR